jgi:hypothetical protein
MMSHWMDARMDSLGSIGVAVNPGVSVGTTKPRTPSWVLAQTIATSSIEAKPIQHLAPVSSQPSPSRTAVVSMLDESLPNSGPPCDSPNLSLNPPIN